MSLTQVTPDVISTNTISGLISAGFTSMNVATMGTQTIDFGSSNTLVFRANTSTERIRISNTGFVGIGTNSPAALLHLAATGGVRQRLQNTGTRQWSLGNNASDFTFFDETAAAERMRITSAGDVLVGRTTGYRAGKLVVSSTNVTQTSTLANLQVTTSDTQAADVGGSIGLGGQVGGGDEVPFVYLSGRKTNSSSGNYAGYFAIAISGGDASTTERMRIASDGRVSINSTTHSQVLGYEHLGVAGSGGFKTTGSSALGLWNTASTGLMQFYTEAGGTYAGALSASGAALTLAGGSQLNLTATGANVMTFSTNSAERMRIDSAGNLLLSATSAISARNELRLGGNNAGSAITMGRAGTNKFLIQLDSGDNVYLENTSATPILLITNNTERIRIPSDAGGIQFPATQAASANANTLDDYEEGTWTATPSPSVSGSFTTSINTGWYVKVGKMVTVGVNIFMSSVSSPVGAVNIAGLPFTSANNVGFRPAVCASGLVLSSFPGPVSGQISHNSTSAILVVNDQGNWANIITGSSQIQFMASYVVS
jgi:hypothetical protein